MSQEDESEFDFEEEQEEEDPIGVSSNQESNIK